MSKNKVDAIYELRGAAEEKGRAEHALAAEPTAENRDALLDARTDLEAKTLQALDACHECGHDHTAGTPHR